MPRVLDSLWFSPAVVGLVILTALLLGCSPRQQQVASGYQQQIAAACGVAMTLAPLAGPEAPWIVGGCATEEAIATLALDPNSLNWVNGLIANAQQK